MPLSTIQIARLGRLYLKKETTFGTVPSLASGNAVRHRSITFPGSDVKNKREIMEKQASPGMLATNMTDGRTSAGFAYEGVLRPSGTLNTLPEQDPLLECGFGSKTNTTLSTTVSTGTGAVGGATLASGTGTAVGLPVLITCPDGVKRARFLTAANTGTGVVTWAPELPAGQEPANGAAVKLGILYRISAQNLLSFSAAHYLLNTDGTAGFSRVLSGAVADKLGISFDANDDPMLTVSGGGKLLSASAAPSQPASFTTVGSQPPSGITGELVLGNTAAKMMKMAIDIENAIKLQNETYGTSSAEASYRAGRMKIGVSLDMRATSQTQYDLAVAGTNLGVFLQTGFTEGNIIAVRMPNVLFQVPDTDDPDDEVTFPLKGQALESVDGGLDAIFVGLL
jgi:hypothetical protein